MTFAPRLYGPTVMEPYWRRYDISYGPYGYGYSRFPVRDASTGSVLPNCTAYAWGRFYEILGEFPSLGRGNAGNWYPDDADGYERGQLPRCGAVMCWAGGQTGEGHVAIVEQVNDDGSIITGESGWYVDKPWLPSTIWWQRTRRAGTDGRWGQNATYTFQGFIYNPAVDSLTHKDQFVQTALSKVGTNKAWVIETTGVSRNSSWSAAFVVGCAKTAGVLNVMIPSTFSCTALGRAGVLRNMGTWLKGPGQGSYSTPEVGDVVMFRNSGKGNTVNTYNADACGIVVNYNNGSFDVVFAGTSAIQKQSYGTRSTYITGYFRPDWDQVDKTESSVTGYNTVQGLYTTTVSKNDAAVREIGYVNSLFKPSIQESKIKLSVLNYTGLLAGLYSAFGGQLATATDSSTADQVSLTAVGQEDYSSIVIDGLTSNQAIVYSYLRNKGMLPAVVCGIMGNIKAESSFNPAATGDRGTSFGICQWHSGRGTQMKITCGGGDEWKTNLTGQLDYLWSELNGSYSSVLRLLNQITNNDTSGVYQATKVFMTKFEVPADQSEAAIAKRNTNSLVYWNAIVKQL